MHLALEMWDEALRDAERARVLSEAAMKRMQRSAGALYSKTFAQKGAALIGEGPRNPMHFVTWMRTALTDVISC